MRDNTGTEIPEPENVEAEGLYGRYLREMCMTHTQALLDAPDVDLTEEEVVLRLILAK